MRSIALLALCAAVLSSATSNELEGEMSAVVSSAAPSPSAHATHSATHTASHSAHATSSPTHSASHTHSATHTHTATHSATHSAKPSHSGTPSSTHTPSVVPSPGEAARLLAQAEAQLKIAAEAHTRIKTLESSVAKAEARASRLTSAATQVHEAELLKGKAAAIEADAKAKLTTAVAAADAKPSAGPRFAAADAHLAAEGEEDAVTLDDLADPAVDGDADAAVVRPSRHPSAAAAVAAAGEAARFPEASPSAKPAAADSNSTAVTKKGKKSETAGVASGAIRPPGNPRAEDVAAAGASIRFPEASPSAKPAAADSNYTAVTKKGKKSETSLAAPGAVRPLGNTRVIPAPPSSAFEPAIEAEVVGERFAQADAEMAAVEGDADAESQAADGDADVDASATAASGAGAAAGLDDHRLAGLAAHVASLAGRKGAGDADARSSLRGRMEGQQVLGA